MQLIEELQRIIEELENASEQLQVAAQTDTAVSSSMNVISVAAVKLDVLKQRMHATLSDTYQVNS